jgi:hypothetical protein
MTVVDAETITEEVVEDLAEVDSQEDVKAEVLVDTEEILVVEIVKAVVTEEIQVAELVKVVATEEILVVAIVKVDSIVKAEVVSDQELHQLAEAIEEVLILAIAEEEAKVVLQKVVQQKEEVLDLKEQGEHQEDQTTNFSLNIIIPIRLSFRDFLCLKIKLFYNLMLTLFTI